MSEYFYLFFYFFTLLRDQAAKKFTANHKFYEQCMNLNIILCIGKLYERFVRERALVKYQFQSELIKGDALVSHF